MNRLEALQAVISPALLQRATALSRRLYELGIPHALVGGLAVGIHGHLRATKDVDFLVGAEAFAQTSPLLLYRDELNALVQLGDADLMSVPSKYPVLAEELRREEQIPIISLRGLVLMKLDAFRPRDQEDLRALFAAYPEQLRALREYLQQHAPLLLSRFAELLARKK